MKIEVKKRNFSSIWLTISATFVTFFYFTKSADPINPPKFWLIGLIAFWCAAELIYSLRRENSLLIKVRSKIFSLIIISFILFLTISFIYTDEKNIGLIGFTGRNNGYLSFIFFILIFIYSVKSIKMNQCGKIFNIISLSCLIFTTYGVLQHFNLDPIRWHTPYNHIILTLGNSDFASALLAIFFTILVGCIFLEKSRIRIYSLIALLLVTFLVIIWSQALQGLVAAAFGSSIVVLGIAYQRYKRLASGLFILFISMGVISVLGMLKIGPLSKLLYKASVNDRGYDWRAAWGMFKSHPWTGVGIDRYAAYFLEYRDKNYPLIYGYTQTVNNSHNVFLEYLATSGFFVFSSYVLLVLFTAWRGFKAWRNTNGRNKLILITLIAGWATYQAQSFISIDNIGLAVWGWILSGFIIGLSFQTENQTKFINKNQIDEFATHKKSIIFLVLGICFTFVLVPMYRGENSYLNFQKTEIPTSKEAKKIYFEIAKKVFDTPLLNPDYKVYIAFTVTNSGNIDLGTRMFQSILKVDPRRHDALNFLATIFEHNKNYQNAIDLRLREKEINPYGADNLLKLVENYLLVNQSSAAKEVVREIEIMAPNSEVVNQAHSLIKY